MDIVQSDKYSKICHPGNFPFKYFADFVTHIVGFQPVFHVAAGVVGTAITERGMNAQSLPAFFWRVGLLDSTRL